MRLPFLNRRAFVFAMLLVIGGIGLGVNWPAAAQNKRLPKRGAHINDFGEVLDAATKQRLEKVLENLKLKTDIDFVVATVKTTGVEDIYDYSLRVVQDWKVGSSTAPGRSVLIVIAGDNGKFFSHSSPGARLYFPTGLMGEMASRMRERIDNLGFSGGLLAGVRTFVDRVGAEHDFDFAALDPQGGEKLIAEQQRPRTVQAQVAEAVSSPGPQPTPTETPAITPAPIASPSREAASPEPTPSVTTTTIELGKTPSPSPSVLDLPSPTPSPSETPSPSASPLPSETPSPVASPLPSETPSPTANPLPSETPSPTASPLPSETPSPVASPSQVEAPTVTESPTPQPSPIASPAEVIAENAAAKVSDPKASTASSNPDDEKEEVELTLTKPLEERIQLLKAFIGAHPASVAVPRANELMVVARAVLADRKMQAGDTAGGLELFRAAISEAPPDIPDRLFTEVIARIPLNLFFRGQRDAAFESARQAEVLAKANGKRLLALAEFYLAIENPDEAVRLSEAAVQIMPESASAHQALGAGRHIGLRLDQAETEYARALALDPKSAAARIALADLKRASGKSEEALALYSEQLQADPKSNPARAGLILSLLESGKTEAAENNLNAALQDKDQSRNLPLLVGAAYWFAAHNDAARGLDLAQKAVAIEPRYSWAQIALARALVASKRPLPAERAIRFARQYGRFPTLDYELATVLASIGLYGEAVQELARSFSLKNGEIATKLAGRVPAHAPTFIELLAPERRAAIFQATAADSEANAKMMKALMAFDRALNDASTREDDLLATAQEFIKGDDAMQTYRQIYVADKFLRKGVALPTVVELMDQSTKGVEAALSVPAATVAIQPEEWGVVRARALAQEGTPEVPEAPRATLSGLLRGRIEDLAGFALFNLDKPAEAVPRLRRAVTASAEGTPLWRTAMWHLGAALEATGKNDQALLYYIKSYVSGPPDPARRSIIENVYKKVNGTLDGLDDKIGPGLDAASATPSPTPSPN